MINVIIVDSASGEWWQFTEPKEVVVVHDIRGIIPSLRNVEHRVNNEQLYAAGFISYEASPAFDKALRVRPHDYAFPLMWFGLFEKPAAIRLREAGLCPRLEWKPTISRQSYDDAIARIKNHIAAGDTYQVNFSFRMTGSCDTEPYDFFLQLTRAQPSRNAAFIETDDFAICSASPELFFSLNGENILARPMKGTAPRCPTLKHDTSQAEFLRSSEKNRAENVMIVDMMRNDIGRIAEVGTVEVPSLFEVEKYPTVWQMTSAVAAKTSASILEILEALFPCASVTGAPKASTMGIIAELESTPRKIYTGAIGFIAPDRKAQFNVAIRTVLIDKRSKVAEYGVGGGVVWDSTPEGEYDECLTKARILTEVRPQFNVFETLLYTNEDGFFLLDEHLTRLRNSCEYFGFAFDKNVVLKILHKAEQQFSHGSFRVKVELHPNGLPALETKPIDAAVLSIPVRVRLASAPVDSNNLFLYHKTTHRTMYDDALASVSNCDDVILWNERGEITESTIANVVVEIDGDLFTPPVECGLLAGTYRAKLLYEGKIKERIIAKDEFMNAKRAFLINSIRQWRELRIVR